MSHKRQSIHKTQTVPKLDHLASKKTDYWTVHHPQFMACRMCHSFPFSWVDRCSTKQRREQLRFSRCLHCRDIQWHVYDQSVLSDSSKERNIVSTATGPGVANFSDQTAEKTVQYSKRESFNGLVVSPTGSVPEIHKLWWERERDCLLSFHRTPFQPYILLWWRFCQILTSTCTKAYRWGISLWAWW